VKRPLKTSILVILVCIAAQWFGATHTRATSLTARDLYLQALDAMSKIDEPPYVSFELVGRSDGLMAVFGQGCSLCLYPGSNAVHWSEIHRTADYLSEVVDLGMVSVN
jgi:hypothetical protein